MKKIYSSVCILIVLLTMCGSSLAGDYANLNVIGFSNDGKYLAFEEYGSYDGSGYPYSNYYFVMVQENIYAAAPIKIEIQKETATEAQARSKAALAAAKKLTQFKIFKGNVGKHVVSRLLNDLSELKEQGDAGETVRFAEIVGSMYQRGNYELNLKQTITDVKDCEAFGMDILKLELSLTNKEDGMKVFLQKDESLPKSRGCVVDYRIQDVYIYERAANKYNIAVFLNTFTPGFEGPDMRYMAVGGKLN